MATWRDQILRITNPLAIMASIFFLGFAFPVVSTKLLFPFRLVITLAGLACVGWITVSRYQSHGLVSAIAAFALTNTALAAIWYVFIMVLFIAMMNDINHDR